MENSVYLAPAIHRRGIGTQLLQRLIADCEARGYRQMIAVIGDSANAGSIGVHTRCGFAMIGTHPNVGFKFGRWLDTVMMQRALGEGATTLPAVAPDGRVGVGRANACPQCTKLGRPRMVRVRASRAPTD